MARPEPWDGSDWERRFALLDAASAASDVDRLRAALRTAVNRIDAYQLECRNLESYLADGYGPGGFCRGSIFEKSYADILAVLNGAEER